MFGCLDWKFDFWEDFWNRKEIGEGEIEEESIKGIGLSVEIEIRKCWKGNREFEASRSREDGRLRKDDCEDEIGYVDDSEWVGEAVSDDRVEFLSSACKRGRRRGAMDSILRRGIYLVNLFVCEC